MGLAHLARLREEPRNASGSDSVPKGAALGEQLPAAGVEPPMKVCEELERGRGKEFVIVGYCTGHDSSGRSLGAHEPIHHRTKPPAADSPYILRNSPCGGPQESNEPAQGGS